MARIEPDMLCLIKKDGECKGMVRTIRLGTEADNLPPSSERAWLCECLNAMRANKILAAQILGRNVHFQIENQVPVESGSEGWVSECYLHPLPGLDDEEGRDTELPLVKEKEHEPELQV